MLGAPRAPIIQRRSGRVPNAVVADGTNDNLSLAGDLAGAADANTWTTAFAVKFNAVNKFQYIYMGRAGTNLRYRIALNSSNNFDVFGRNSSATVLVDAESVETFGTGVWHAVLMSVDLSDAANFHVYVDDVALTMTLNQFNDGLIDFTPGENNVFANPPGDSPFNLLDGEVSEIWGDFGRYVDFDVESNRRKFFDASNCLVDKGSDGSTPFGAAPILFLKDPAATFNVNSGTGGNYTLFGSFADSVAPPCGA